MLGQIRNGELKAIAVGTAKPSAILPDLLPIADTVAGYEASSWFGLLAPAGTPKPIIDKLHAETVKVLAQPEMRLRLEGLGLQLVGNTPEQFVEIAKNELPMWGRVIKDAGIKMPQ